MMVVDVGHKYLLKNNKADTCTELTFFKDACINDNGYAGTTNQEVVRALIDRIKFLDSQVPHKVNSEILYHLRKVIVLHEQRHMDRLLDKGVPVEDLVTFNDSHVVTINKGE